MIKLKIKDINIVIQIANLYANVTEQGELSFALKRLAHRLSVESGQLSSYGKLSEKEKEYVIDIPYSRVNMDKLEYYHPADKPFLEMIGTNIPDFKPSIIAALKKGESNASK